MAGLLSQPLTLPEEFVLLSQLDTGHVRDVAQTAVGCAAAELGELALRRHLLVRANKSRKFGFEVYSYSARRPGEISLLSTEPIGIGWADALLAELHQSAAGDQPLKLPRWLRHRGHAALALHRAALADRGLLRHEPRTLWRRERHHTDRETRNALLAEVRAAHQERVPLDARLMFLCDLAEKAELMNDLGLTLTFREHLARARAHARGTDPESQLPEDLRDTSVMLTTWIPSRKG
ncbi:GPP34 family phosphoprotein [Streptomyces sp. NPDC057702]|uniref:GPP34 family phosphoprotein n=1 Tax=unclassified Streptomyces TaxID=2593676 RepID=UPI0036BEA2F0